MGGIDQWGIGRNTSFFWLELHEKHKILELHKIEKINPFILGQQ
jgi:hypothetical protein